MRIQKAFQRRERLPRRHIQCDTYFDHRQLDCEECLIGKRNLKRVSPGSDWNSISPPSWPDIKPVAKTLGYG